MKSRLRVKVALLAALGLGISLVPGAHAQNAANVRVARLSATEGQVLVSHAGGATWENAPVNLPLQEGDTLTTQDGQAAIEFEDGATAFLAKHSVLQITQLGFSSTGRVTELGLIQGAGTFNAAPTGQDSFRVRALTFIVTIPGQAEFRVDGFRDGAAVEVLLGEVSVSTARGSTNLERGQGVAVHENELHDFSIGSLPNAEDAFDQWVTQQGEMIRAGNKNTLSYINSPSYYGLSDLSRYGTWVNVAGFGFSWRPFSVGFTWTPYFNGKWILNPILGWIWVSGETWGWMPYHFGSWLLAPNLGWIWVPGGPAGLQQWQAARVNWVRIGDQVGWVAMSPKDRDGTPANATKGVVTKLSPSPGNGNESNRIVSGKELQSLTLLKQPPAESDFHLAAGAPRTVDGNKSTLLDRGARTFVNRNGGDERNGKETVKSINAPVAPAPLMPLTNAQAELPRVTPQPPPVYSSTPILLSRPRPTALTPRGNAPPNGVLPARAPMGAPLNTQRHPVAPQQATPRPVAPPPTTHPTPAKTGSGTRPAGQTAQPGSPPAGAEHH